MEIQPGYKQTELGAVPEDWQPLSLGQLGKWRGGATPSMQNPMFWANGTIPWVSSGDVKTSLLSDTATRITGYALRNSSTTLLRAGCIIVVTRSGILRKFLPVAKNVKPMAINQDIKALIPETRYPSDYLLHLVNSMGPRILATCLKSGTTVESIEFPWLKSTIVYLPPTRLEQEQIAAALNDADALIESLEQLLTKKRNLKQGASQELLSGTKRLSGFGGEWQSLALRNFVRDFVVPMRDKPKRFGGDVPWCRIEDFDGVYLETSKSGQCVNAETIRSMNLKVYSVGTLLVSCSADLGRCALIAAPLVSNQTFIGLEFEPKRACNLFFYYYMTSRASELNNLSSGTTISYLSRKQFEEFLVYVPTDVAEQEAIATLLNDMDDEISALESRLEKVRQLKQGMMQELLTGRIRLV